MAAYRKIWLTYRTLDQESHLAGILPLTPNYAALLQPTFRCMGEKLRLALGRDRPKHIKMPADTIFEQRQCAHAGGIVAAKFFKRTKSVNEPFTYPSSGRLATLYGEP